MHPADTFLRISAYALTHRREQSMTKQGIHRLSSIFKEFKFSGINENGSLLQSILKYNAKHAELVLFVYRIAKD